MVASDPGSTRRSRNQDPRRLVLGSVQWGMPYGIANQGGPPDDPELARMLSRAKEAGVRTIDTARAYGESELRIGKLLPTVPRRDGWQVITKLAHDVHEPGVSTADALDRVFASLAASRSALDLDGPPDLMLHRFAHRHACGGKLWRMLLAERDAGRLGRLGISAATPEEAWAALEEPEAEILQVASSLLDLRLFRQGFFSRARALGRTVYVRSIFLQGVAHLEPRALPDFLFPLRDAISRIRAAAQALDVTPRALFLGFARELLPGAHLVVGCEREGQLVQLLEDWFDDRVEASDLAALVEALPTHEAGSVDPSQWPKPDPPDPSSRTTRRSAANFQR